jgi:hypothetical protein
MKPTKQVRFEPVGTLFVHDGTFEWLKSLLEEDSDAVVLDSPPITVLLCQDGIVVVGGTTHHGITCAHIEGVLAADIEDLGISRLQESMTEGLDDDATEELGADAVRCSGTMGMPTRQVMNTLRVMGPVLSHGFNELKSETFDQPTQVLEGSYPLITDLDALM